MKAGNSVNTTVQFKDGKFHYVLGKADIRDMHINKKGDMDFLVTDVYDFNKNDPSDLVQVARNRQDKGEIKPYFIIYHVIIPKNSILKEEKNEMILKILKSRRVRWSETQPNINRHGI